MNPILHREFLYHTASFPSCHASTIVQTRRGLLAAFFGGSREGAPDVRIWTCRREDGRWSETIEAANGLQPDGSSQPTWNPVLFHPVDGPLMLFYRVGPSPSSWRGMVRTSDDDGITWNARRELPYGLLGPIKNKPIQLPGGTIISPSSIESADKGWQIYFERSTDNGQSFSATPLVDNPLNIKAIQPSILMHSSSRLQALGRTRSARMFQTWSEDSGVSWSALELIDLPNCNSGTDAVTLADGRHLLVYNHSTVEKVRIPLNVAISPDGRRWFAGPVLESEPPGQYSYPAVIQTTDGLIHITYTWRRLKIGYVVLDPAGLSEGDPIEGIAQNVKTLTQK